MATEFITSISIEQEDSFLAGKELAQEAMKKSKTKNLPTFAVLFSSIKYDYSAIVRGIKSIIGEKITIIGCSSAGQFSEENFSKEGIACAFISSDNYQFFSGIGTNLKDNPIGAIENAIRPFPQDVPEFPYQSAILFVDGLAGKGEEAVLAAASLLDPKVVFAGGAAADNLSFRETTVFKDEASLSDAVSMCLIVSRKPVIISVKHGHKPISQPLKVTKAEGNILYELDGKPALEVWKDVLRDRLKSQGIDIEKVDPQDLSKILLKYEAGLLTGANEYKIRFPVSCNPDGSFNFVCSITEGAVVKVMDSEVSDQINATRQAAELAMKASAGQKLAGAVVFDCACRAMILKEEFTKAIASKKYVFKNLPFIGCETYGEIAMDPGQFSGFHNTTTVIMLFPD